MSATTQRVPCAQGDLRPTASLAPSIDKWSKAAKFPFIFFKSCSSDASSESLWLVLSLASRWSGAVRSDTFHPLPGLSPADCRLLGVNPAPFTLEASQARAHSRGSINAEVPIHWTWGVCREYGLGSRGGEKDGIFLFHRRWSEGWRVMHALGAQRGEVGDGTRAS